jgi:hypothetical protein
VSARDRIEATGVDGGADGHDVDGWKRTDESTRSAVESHPSAVTAQP